MRLRCISLVAAVVAVMPVGVALGQVQAYELNFTSSGTARLAGGFSWSGPLPANGTYDFASGGSPIVAASFTLNAVPNTSTLSGSLAMPGLVPSLTGTFQMTTATPGTGTANFQSDGTPMANPSFTFDGSTFTNLPNQNDRYAWSAGNVTALKYNVSSLLLNIDNTFVDPFFNLTGGYSINRTGGNSYSLSGWTDGTFPFGSNGSPAATPSLTAQGTAFTNLPNQTDSYRLAGGDVTRLKYDLAAAGKTLGLALDGSYVVQAGATILESGSYAMTHAGSDVYTLAGNNASATARFTNLPNQNDDYQVVGNQLTRLKYGLVSQGGFDLLLKLDGTYDLRENFTLIDTGTYVIAVPEPTTATLATVVAACLLGRWLRRRGRASSVSRRSASG